MDIYKELVEKALPFIKAFQDDLLKHDKKQIEDYPDRKFLHFTGDTGTTMLTLYYKEDYPDKNVWVPYLFGHADRHHMLKGITETLKVLPGCNRMKLILYYNGTTLESIAYEQAKQIVSNYTDVMQNFFARG